MQTMLDMDEHHWWYRGRRRIIDVELRKLALPSHARVLDAGCGSGRTLQELGRYGEVSGIELSPDAAAVARDRGAFDVRIGRLEELPWPDQTFDLITCLDVIEHTPDDRVTLRELHRVTRRGGHLLVTVPAYQALWSQHDVDNHHFRRYEREPLRQAAEQSGWTVTRLTSFNSVLLPAAAAVRLIQRRRMRPAGNGNANGNENRNGNANANADRDDFKADLNLGPAWLNGLLEQPLHYEARWLARGRTLPAGLSLLAVLTRP